MQTELNSFLIEITALIFGKKDDQGGDDFLLDKVLDKTGMKGTGNSPLHHYRSRPAQGDGSLGHDMGMHMKQNIMLRWQSEHSAWQVPLSSLSKH